mmetsp:Transcript_14634/g.35054  ORF Transcript_14634/g.35054 Transcript_14634/m.35054 type:complete len:131 (+) Transcript_14634:369-761(+)
MDADANTFDIWHDDLANACTPLDDPCGSATRLDNADFKQARCIARALQDFGSETQGANEWCNDEATNAAHHALRDCLCRTFLQSPVGISNDTSNAMKERHAKELSALDDSIPDVSSSVLAFVGLLWFQIL